MPSWLVLKSLRLWQEWFFVEGSARMPSPRLCLQTIGSANLRSSVRAWAVMKQILWYGLLFRVGSVFFRRCVSNGLSIEISHANRFLSFLNKACKRLFPVQRGGHCQLREHLDEKKPDEGAGRHCFTHPGVQDAIFYRL